MNITNPNRLLDYARSEVNEARAKLPHAEGLPNWQRAAEVRGHIDNAISALTEVTAALSDGAE